MLAFASHLGPCEMLAPPGAGGSDEVYRTRGARIGRDVAIGVLSPLTSAAAEVHARLEHVARTLSQIDHPNTRTLHDIGRQGETEDRGTGKRAFADPDEQVVRLQRGRSEARHRRPREREGCPMRNRSTVMTLGLAAVVLAACVCPAAGEAPANAPMRIGVYDSRGVAIAYARSAEFRQRVAKLRDDLQQARAKGDSAQVKKLETEGPWMQVRLHQRGFSTAGAGDLLAKVAGSLPGVAREAGVLLIVSKWEMPYRDPAVEIVDVTLSLARLFKPDEATLKILDELEAQKPIPLDELPLDAND